MTAPGPRSLPELEDEHQSSDERENGSERFFHEFARKELPETASNLRGTGSNGATPLNGNVQKNEQERRKGRKTGNRDGLRVQEDLFLSSCELLATLPLSRSVTVPEDVEPKRTSVTRSLLCAFAPLR